MSAKRNHMAYLRQSFGFWGLLTVFVPAILAVLLLSAGTAANGVAQPMMRWWGRTMLRWFRVELVVEPALRSELALRRRRVVTFNHASTMDIFLMTALWPEGAVAVVKREILWVPLMGQAIYFLNFLPLDRGNRDKAVASLRAAAAQMRKQNLTVMIAPEGTRSPNGEVGPFKQGAFHLAAAAQAPIVPVVLHGGRELWPMWQAHCEPGTVTAQLLPELAPCPTEDGAELHAQANALRQSYVDALAAGPQAERVDLSC